MANPSTTYRLAQGHALQLFGWRMIIAAALVPVSFVLTGVGGFVRTLGVVTAVLAVALVLFAVWTLLRPPVVVQVRADGFRLGRVAGSAIRSAAWTDVERVRTVEGHLVLELGGGVRGRIPLGLLPQQADALKRDVHERLNAAHGYRRLT